MRRTLLNYSGWAQVKMKLFSYKQAQGFATFCRVRFREGAHLSSYKAETLRKRLIPGAREYNEVFAFIDFGGPPTNNHAERALRPLVLFRKISMGTRSPTGSQNIGVFASLTQTAKLQDTPVIELLNALLTGTPDQAQTALFPDSEKIDTS
jgi:hypothetical protein